MRTFLPFFPSASTTICRADEGGSFFDRLPKHNVRPGPTPLTKAGDEPRFEQVHAPGVPRDFCPLVEAGEIEPECAAGPASASDEAEIEAEDILPVRGHVVGLHFEQLREAAFGGGSTPWCLRNWPVENHSVTMRWRCSGSVSGYTVKTSGKETVAVPAEILTAVRYSPGSASWGMFSVK